MAQIIWIETAKLAYWKNIEYLEREWTSKEGYNFMNKADNLIKLLAACVYPKTV